MGLKAEKKIAADNKAEFRKLNRKVAAEGAILLKNEGGLLPFSSGCKLAVFGRTQTFYYKSGTGSGGLVHIEKEPCILTALRECKEILLDEETASVYESWIKENPFDNGNGGWASEPWCQTEMPLCDEVVARAARKNDAALVIIGRTAGEDKDNFAEKGSYYLTDTEEEMLCKVTSHFERVAVVLNIGNIIDMSFLDRHNIASLLIVWQGGEEGANALCDLLSGKAAPSGKLTDTVAFELEDYPSQVPTIADDEIFYDEDIYVGYRYFETFKPDRVRFPFGYGLTYTEFSVCYEAEISESEITVTAKVTNVGKRDGKEVVEVYFEAPNGRLGTPSRQLAAYKKTGTLKSGESETVTLKFNPQQMAAFDDSGISGHPFSYVMEPGIYRIFAGVSVKDAEEVASFPIPKLKVISQTESVMPPQKELKRLVSAEKDGRRTPLYQTVYPVALDLERRITENLPQNDEFTGDRGIKLRDVFEQKNSMSEFLAQLSDEDLFAIVCGEGMDSPKATRGTVGAFGGLTEGLRHFGIPVCCVSDGPSGLRLDTGAKATLIPNGTLIASMFDDELTEKLFGFLGREISSYGVDGLLGPGMNIHRNVLCGRNFEYFSEDPYLSGKTAAAISRGLSAYGTFATIKHFCCNNWEKRRHYTNSIVSERALREIYLKGFEIAVKEGKNISLMTSYNLINGFHAASNYDLNTTVLRKEWGFCGMVMTDWWAKSNSAGEVGDKNNLKAMIRAQNDIYMVCGDTLKQPHNLREGLADKSLTRGELMRSAGNILELVMKTGAWSRYLSSGVLSNDIKYDKEKLCCIASLSENIKKMPIEVDFDADGFCILSFSIKSNADSLAQNSVFCAVDDLQSSFSVNGERGETVVIDREMYLTGPHHKITVYLPGCLELTEIKIYLKP